jgi:hypothetical protein
MQLSHVAGFLQTRLEALNVAFLDGTYNYKAFNSRPPAPKEAPKEPPQDAAADPETVEATTEADGSSDAPAAAAAAGKPPTMQFCRHYNQSDVAKLRHQLMVLPGEVDLLLTCEWPAGLLQGLPAGQDQVAGEVVDEVVDEAVDEVVGEVVDEVVDEIADEVADEVVCSVGSL